MVIGTQIEYQNQELKINNMQEWFDVFKLYDIGAFSFFIPEIGVSLHLLQKFHFQLTGSPSIP